MKRIIIAILMILTVGAGLRPALFAAEPAKPSAKLEKVPTLTMYFNLARVTFSPTINVIVPAKCPKCYVGLYGSSSPTAVMLQWRYFTGDKDKSDAAIAARSLLTAGTVIFTDVAYATHEARIYRLIEGDAPDELLYTIALEPPPVKVEVRTLESEKTVATRVPVGNRDEITLTRWDGSATRWTMDRGVIFEMAPIAPPAAPHLLPSVASVDRP